MPSLAPTLSLDDVQGAIEAAADHAPAPLQPWLAALAGALAAAVAVLGAQELAKRLKNRGTHKCPRCNGRGRENESEKCATCGGTRMVEEEQEVTVECPNCKGEGEVQCEKCEGEGKIDGVPCHACGGKGAELDDEGEALECLVCRGEGELTSTVKRNVPCPDCQG